MKLSQGSGDKELSLFPLISTAITPGKENTRFVDLHMLTQPFFIVGSEPRSQIWIIENRDRLRKLQARGLLVEALDHEDLKLIRSIAKGFTIVPAKGEPFAEKLNLKHYPVLITDCSIGQ